MQTAGGGWAPLDCWILVSLEAELAADLSTVWLETLDMTSHCTMFRKNHVITITAKAKCLLVLFL